MSQYHVRIRSSDRQLSACLTKIFLGSLLVSLAWIWSGIDRPAVAIKDEAESFLYKPQFLMFSLVPILCEVDPTAKKLYCCGYEDTNEGKVNPQQARPVRNILTRWDLSTGKCERVKSITGSQLFINQISPDGACLLGHSVNEAGLDKLVSDPKQKVRYENLEIVTSLISTSTLEQVHLWKSPIVALGDIEREAPFFEGKGVGFLIWQRKGKQVSYTLSRWQLLPEVREETRFPLLGLEKYVVEHLHPIDKSLFLFVAYELNEPAGDMSTSHLLSYDVSQKRISKKIELGKVSSKQISSGERTGDVTWNRERGWALVTFGESVRIYERDNSVISIQTPRDANNHSLRVCGLSPDGKYIVFASKRIVLYDLEEKKYKVFDTFLEELCQSWDNPPAMSRLAQVVNHPIAGSIMPVLKMLTAWSKVTFLGKGEELLGITTYGKVVIWDVKSGKIINSFRIQETCFDRETERILGLY